MLVADMKWVYLMQKTKSSLPEPKKFEEPLCAQVGFQFFYIDDEDDDTVPEEMKNNSYKTAIEICKMCIHKTECAEWGIYREKWGVWGGLTPYDRVTIRKRFKITLLDSQ